MNNSDRDPDAYDRIREDAMVSTRPCGYCNFTGDVLSYAQHVCPRDVLQSEIDSLRAQLAACRKIRTNYSMGVDPIEYDDLYHRAEGEIDSLRAQLARATAKDSQKTREINLLTQENRQQAAQLAAATEREPQRMYLFLIQEACDCLTSLLSEDEDETHPEATIVRDRLAAALAAAQPKEGK